MFEFIWMLECYLLRHWNLLLWLLRMSTSASKNVLRKSTSVLLFIFLFFFVKRMSKSASRICETDVNIRFIICFLFLWNGCRHSFRYFFLFFCETDVEICFRNLWNGCRNPFQEVVKRMSTSISLFFFFWFFVYHECRHPVLEIQQ